MLGGMTKSPSELKPHIPLRLLAVRGHPVPNELVRAGPRYAVHREVKLACSSALWWPERTSPGQPPHVVLDHLVLEFGGAHRRIAKPTRGCYRALRGRRVLKKRYLQFGGHSRRKLLRRLGTPVLLLNLSTRPAVSTSFCLPV